MAQFFFFLNLHQYLSTLVFKVHRPTLNKNTPEQTNQCLRKFEKNRQLQTDKLPQTLRARVDKPWFTSVYCIIMCLIQNQRSSLTGHCRCRADSNITHWIWNELNAKVEEWDQMSSLTCLPQEQNQLAVRDARVKSLSCFQDSRSERAPASPFSLLLLSHRT